MTFRIEDGLLKAGDVTVSLPLPVRGVLDLNGVAAVILKVPAGQRLNRNVFLIDGRGGTVWQIEESPHGGEQDKPFMDIWLDEKGRLVAGNWNGIDYNVDLNSGRISVKSFPR